MYTQNLPFNPVTNYQIGFQDAASPVAEGISAFHNDLIILVRFILRFVLYIRAYVLINFEQNVKGIVTTNVQNVGY
jgi:cytochrome c oxidase subunit 2